MKLLNVRVSRFRGATQLRTLVLGNVTALVGANGTGKSAFVDGLLLVGSRHMHDFADLPSWSIDPRIDPRDVSVQVDLEIDLEVGLLAFLMREDAAAILLEHAELEKTRTTSWPADLRDSYVESLDQTIAALRGGKPRADQLVQGLSHAFDEEVLRYRVPAHLEALQPQYGPDLNAGRILVDGELLDVKFTIDHADGPHIEIRLRRRDGTILLEDAEFHYWFQRQKVISDPFAMMLLLGNLMLRGVGTTPADVIEHRLSGALMPDQQNLAECVQALRATDPDRVEWIRTGFKRMFQGRIDFSTAAETDPRGPGALLARLKFGRGAEDPVRFDKLSQGMRRALAILYQLSSPVGTCVIDEPELHLHPGAARALRDIIRELDGQKQILLATHSPIFFDSSIADHVYVHRRKGAKLSHSRLDPSEQDVALTELGVTGLDAMLYDAVLWVEGPSDKIYLEKAIAEFGAAARIEASRIGVLSFGGRDSVKHIAPRRLAQLTPRSVLLFDRDDGIDRHLRNFIAKCRRAGVATHVWRARTIENYLGSRLIESYFGLAAGSVPLTPRLNLKKHLKPANNLNNHKMRLAHRAIAPSEWPRLARNESFKREVRTILGKLRG